MKLNTKQHALGYVLLSRAARRVNLDLDLDPRVWQSTMDVLYQLMAKIDTNHLYNEVSAIGWVNAHWRFNATMEDI